MSVASFARLPQIRPRKRHRLGQRVAADMPGRERRAEARARRPAPPSPRCPGRRARPACRRRRRSSTRSTRGRSWSSRSTCAISGCAQMAHFRPKRGRQRLLQMRAPGHHGVAVAIGLGGQRGDDRQQLGADQRQPVAHLQHRGGVHDVLRRGAPMRPAARPRRRRATGRRPGRPRVADVARAGGEFRGVEVLEARRRRRSPAAASAGMMPSRACTRASAASTSSMRWK